MSETSFRKVIYYIVVLLSIVVIVWILTHKERYDYTNTSDSVVADNTPKRLATLGSLGSWNIDLEVADTEAKREQGLSDRDSLPEESGMLFVFDAPSAPSFWMKDMRFPIDFIWINKDMEVVEVLPNIDPSTYPEEFGPLEPIQYVIEVNAGAAERHGIKIGDILKLAK